MTKEIRGFSYLDAIRPDPGWETEMALVTSYSCDMVVLVAVMLSLAGLDDDRGSGSKVDFASAHEKLSDRVRFLVQAGRLSVPSSKPAILGIMDQFVCEMKTNEGDKSWHPKLALIRYTNSDQGLVQWRFWIGSRNLTRDNSYDMGLILVSNSGEEGTQIAGIGDIGRSLLNSAELKRYTPSSIKRELDGATWVSPQGVSVRRIEFRHDGSSAGLPKIPEGLEELLVVSPFLDGGIIQKLGSWGSSSTTRLLLSSRTALSALLDQKQHPTNGFDQLLYLESPDNDEEAEERQDEAEQILRGLHVKLICAKLQKGARVWLGSANATARGWQGVNTEAIAELDISDDLYSEIRDFVANCRELSEDDQDIVESDPHEELLEQIRKKIVSKWDARLVFENSFPTLESDVELHPWSSSVRMEVGLLTSHLVNCPHGVRSLKLPAVNAYQLTEFVLIHLSIDEFQVKWVQKVGIVDGLPSDRDQRALAHHLKPRAFLEWIRSLLHPESIGDGGGSWDDESKPGKRNGGSLVLTTPWWAPSLEEVLRAWSCNPNSLRPVSKKLKAYVKYLSEQDNEATDSDDLAILKEFKKTWDVIRPELMKQKGNG